MIKFATGILMVGTWLLTNTFSATAQENAAFKTVKFPSKDGIEITADVYEADPGRTYILLCHQAGFSRGEYRETAPKFIELGFNCMAIDQRSGKEANGIVNETAKRAGEKKLPTTYAAAEQDIIAAIDYLYEKNKKPVILLGSSYSAALVLKIGNSSDKVSEVISFSPGEYVKGVSITESVKGMEKRLFVTSSKSEAADVKKVVSGVDPKYVVQFVPAEEGKHGSRALWQSNSNNKAYWEALVKFMNEQ